MFRTSRCFARTSSQLDGPDAIVAVLRYPYSLSCSFGFSFSTSSFAERFFARRSASQFTSGPLFAAQVLGGSPTAKVAVIIS
jgi:hypothetical protein